MGVKSEETKAAPKNIIDMLLGADAGRIKLPTKEFEIKRLSEQFGAPFNVTLEAVPQGKWEDLQELCISMTSRGVNVDTSLLQSLVVIESTYEDEEAKKPLFKNQSLMDHFGVTTPKNLLKKLLLSGEITGMYNAISELSGFGEDALEEVKN